MLFNSYVFIFIFLPLVLGGFTLLKSKHRMGFLVFASLIFYTQSQVEDGILLLVSCIANYLFANRLTQSIDYKRVWLGLAIVFNLLPLMYFKYNVFLPGQSHSLVLPLAISFYTFQQIAYLVDVYKKKIQRGTLGEYLFFVLFFPQLVAGPIVHYGQMMLQVQQGALNGVKWQYIYSGLVLFSMGLFKKVVLADQLLPLANAAFLHIDTLNTFSAWVGLLAYALGLYFDFSGYTDMAIGLGLLFGLRLPVNFDSPYKAVDIVDFWRRWHITLSHFLRDYVYIPLGGNKKGEFSEVLNLMITMTIGGLWHGSGWNFILWGLLHGVFLAVVHLKNRHLKHLKVPRAVGVLVTFMLVCLLWVLFRSENLEEAWVYYGVLFNGSGELTCSVDFWLVCLALGIVWFLPNSMRFVDYFSQMKTLGWQYAFVAALAFFISLKMMAEAPAQTFVYFNF